MSANTNWAQELLTTKEVEELTGGIIKESTLRFWRFAQDGRGPRSFALEGRVVYKRSDVLKWLDEQYAAGADS